MPGIAQRISADDSCDNNATSSQNSSAGNENPAFHSFNCSSISRNGFWSQHQDVSHIQLQKFWSELSPQARRKLLRIDKQALFEHARKNMYCSRCNGLLLEGFSQIVMYGKSLDQDADGSPHIMKATDDQNDVDLCLTNGCQDVVQDPLVHPWGGLGTAKDGTLTLLDCYLYSKSLEGLQNVFDSARARERERELLYPDACGGGGRGWISQGVAGYGGRGHGTRETCALHTARLSVETLVDFWSALGEETRQSLLRMKEEDFIDRLVYRFESKRFCRDCRRNVIREFKELKELKRMRRQTRCTSWFCVADTAFQCEVSHDTVQADWHEAFSEAFGKYHHFEWAIGSEEGKYDILEFENVGLRGKVQVNGLDLIGLNACYITLKAWRMDGRCNELCVKAHALRGKQCVHRRLVVGDGFLTITRGESITRFFEHAEEAEEEEDDDSVDKDGNDLDECTRPQKHAKSPELAREFLLDAATVIFKEQVEKAFREGTARQNAHSIFVCLSLNLLEERIYIACKDIITLEKQMKLLEEEEKEKREEEERRERKRTKEREKKLRRKERLREKENLEKKCVEPDLTDVVKEASVDQGVNDLPDADYDDERDEASQSELLSPDIQDTCSYTENPSHDILDEEFDSTSDWNTPFSYDEIKYSRRKPSFHKDSQMDSNLKCSDRKRGPTRSEDGFEFTRSVNAFSKQLRTNAARSNLNRSQVTRGALPDVSKPYHRGKKYNHELNSRHKSKIISGNTKKVWEPLDSKKKCIRSDSDSDITLRSIIKVEPESDKLHECCSPSSDKAADISAQTNQEEDNDVGDLKRSVTKSQDSSTSTSSNSDTFLSCRSDGTSTSDSEESIQISDGKEISDHLKNPRVHDDRIQEAEKESISISSQPPSVLPQIHSTRDINYPVFQTPTMGYYHQNPVSCPSNSVNGPFPFPHSNHYLFPNGFRYGVQYPPLINHTNAPVFHPVSQVNGARTNATGLKEMNCSTPKDTDVGNNGFSLFHFGGPVALSTRFIADQMSLNEGIMEDMKKSSANCTDGNHPCGKKESIEEYNLFAATKGITFSIF